MSGSRLAIHASLSVSLHKNVVSRLTFSSVLSFSLVRHSFSETANAFWGKLRSETRDAGVSPLASIVNFFFCICVRFLFNEASISSMYANRGISGFGFLLFTSSRKVRWRRESVWAANFLLWRIAPESLRRLIKWKYANSKPSFFSLFIVCATKLSGGAEKLSVERNFGVRGENFTFCAHSLSVLSNLMSEFCHQAYIKPSLIISSAAASFPKQNSSLALRNRWNFSYNSVKYQTTRKFRLPSFEKSVHTRNSKSKKNSN